MPNFTLIKHPDNEQDAEVTVSFQTDMLIVAQEHVEDFLKASGFELPLEDETPCGSTPIWSGDDWEWDDALESKFGNNQTTYDPVTAKIFKFPVSDS